ncbi:hypothetical protein ASPZODRAFT_59439 [Penicilliopsis zonata CBS 506.65]|uniref:DUF1993 domain-containing protein n=1 Tax=Penicilliopsis zonata CBS 506.65 TaxID=1073090 RepID=A0A1L9SSR9_9EURO|nr:hypothetical protein ASPZODRAFT_59439 [Penicilliopsis zonata CBS 506.65]OJJ50229.1 hypothetical protein ASPZODRAFT_59439 [Penicilliopsis zonata CBS 506.65]
MLATDSYSTPLLLSGLQTISVILSRAADYATTNNIPLADIYNATHSPTDPKPLYHQIKGAVRIATTAVSVLTETSPVVVDDSFSDFEGLQAFVEEAIAAIKKATDDPTAFKKDTADEISFPFEGKEVTAPAGKYLAGYMLPEYFFHIGNAYAILKINKVPLNKMVYLQSFNGY